MEQLVMRLILLAALWVCFMPAAYSETPGGEVDAVQISPLPPPYFEPDSVLCTWDEARRMYNYILLPQYRHYWNAFFGADSKDAPDSFDYRDKKYIGLTLDQVKLIGIGVDNASIEDYRLAKGLECRIDKLMRTDSVSTHLVFASPMYNVSPELKQSVEDDIEWLNGIIDLFLADGYTPYNVMRRLWDENVYLNLPPTFMKLFAGSFYCWPLAAMWKQAVLRVWQSDEYREALANHAGGHWVDLGPDVDSKTYAAKLNMSEGMLYYALRGHLPVMLTPYISTQGGKIRGNDPSPNVLRTAYKAQLLEQKRPYMYPVRYLHREGVYSWIGDSLDWQDLKPPVDPGDF